MFERFTEQARMAVVLAQEEARAAAEPCIDGAHLLLGVSAAGGPGGRALAAAGVDPARLRTTIRQVGDPDGALDAEALAALGIDLDRVRESAEAAFGAGALDDEARPQRRRRPAGHLPFTRTSKHALEQSLRAVIRRGDRSIDTRHVLLGLLAVQEKRTTAVLARLGVDTADLRRRLEDDADAA
jgi:ATP-dependent Clp protease ATP-binding subunit ClpA